MRALARYFLILLIAFVTGCAAPVRAYRFDADVTPMQRAEVRRAMDLVNEKILPDERVYEAADDEYLDEVWSIQFADKIWHPTRGYVAGVTCRARSVQSATCPIGPYMIRIVRGLTPDQTILVSEHEILHSLGLDHVSTKADRASIMQPDMQWGATHWTDDDTAECQRVGVCASVMARPAH